jgi:DNA repair protein RecN (Recombination protein N)
MLRVLTAKDFAIIEHAELAPGEGMTALTGETGAGKSLMVDALLLLCGARGDAAMVRAGRERAELSAEFDLARLPDVAAMLRELEVDDGTDCRLRRVLRADGTSRAFVNDRPVTLATLRDIASNLVEIHGQHEHQALLHRARQLAIVDAHGGHAAEVAEVARLARAWQQLEREAEDLRGRSGGPGAQALDFLRFQIDELARHALEPEALARAEAEHRRLAARGELLSGAERALEALDGEHDAACRPLLNRLAGDLERLAATDPGLAEPAKLLREAALQVDEASAALDRYRARQDLDPERLGELDRQLARVHELARKHRVPVAELKARETSLREEHDAVAGADARLAAVLERQAAVRRDYDAAAAALGRLRRATGERLGTQVGALMDELGMHGGRLVVAWSTQAGDSPAVDGLDAVEFMVAANPGQPERALRKVASGGELSRISLAIEVAALGRGDVPTMVFDEVDTGIGGAVAEVVGRKLRELGRTRQVLCVTHLPQVAAQADRQLSVRKEVHSGATRTRLQALDADARLEEIARMLGGVDITRETRAHARDMLKRASSAD